MQTVIDPMSQWEELAIINVGVEVICKDRGRREQGQALTFPYVISTICLGFNRDLFDRLK